MKISTFKDQLFRKSWSIRVLCAALVFSFAITTETEVAAAECSVTVGRVVPITGPLLDMGRETPWLDENKIKSINAAGGLKVGNQKCKIKYKIFCQNYL